MKTQKQLDPHQHHDLQNLVAKYDEIFNRYLGVNTHQKVYVDLLPGLEQLHHHAYPIP